MAAAGVTTLRRGRARAASSPASSGGSPRTPRPSPLDDPSAPGGLADPGVRRRGRLTRGQPDGPDHPNRPPEHPEDPEPVRKPDYTRRVAVTGLGLVSPIGDDIDTAWQQPGQRRLRPRADHPLGPDAVRLQGRRRGPRLRPERLDELQGGPPDRPQRRPRRGRGEEGARPLRPRGRPTRNRDDIGVYLRLGRRRHAAPDGQHGDLGDEGRRVPSARSSSPTCCPTRPPARSPSRPGIRGPNMCIVTACSTGTHNIGEAAELIRRGDVVAAHRRLDRDAAPRARPRRLRQHARAWARPARASRTQTVSRPFDLTRNGFVLGEGAGAVILEDLELREGARGDDLRRGRRLRLGRRRLGPDPAGREGRRRPPGDDRRRSSATASGRSGST